VLRRTFEGDLLKKFVGLVRIGANIVWAGGFGMLAYDIWRMRSGSQSVALFLVATIAIVAGAVVSSLARSSHDEEAPPVAKRALGLAVTPYALSAFLWVTAVYPSQSEQGTLARTFFAALQAKDYETAHGLLAEPLRTRMKADQLSKSLPTHYVQQDGVSINGVSSGLGTVAGDASCVDGWVYVSGKSHRFGMGLVQEPEGLRVSRLERRPCDS